MKYSKSILIFLFVSSTVSAFYYALDRTKANVGQSIMFTMYFLGIKIGLIGPTVVRAFDPPEQNEQLVAKVGVLPVFHPYISASNDSFDRSSVFALCQSNSRASSRLTCCRYQTNSVFIGKSMVRVKTTAGSWVPIATKSSADATS